MKKIEVKTTVVALDNTAVTAEVIKQTINSAVRAVVCDKNICYEVACIYDGELEQDLLIPSTREVPVNKEPYKRFNNPYDPYDPLYVANSVINSNAPQEE